MIRSSSNFRAAGRCETRDFAEALRIVRLHCDADGGAPYWIERIRSLGIRVARDIKKWEDLGLFGWMDEAAMRRRPVFDFVPKSVLAKESGFIPAETSGFLGTPKSAIYTRRDFEAAFIQPFLPAARFAGFPLDGLWLYLGPGGPHPIGRAAARLGRLHGRAEPFSVDFDPRWFNRLAPDSLARDRYLQHLIDQALRIILREPVDVLFATPAVLEKLASLITPQQRARVRGVHYGGQPLGEERFRRLEEEYFPRAVHLGGYGNSLLGVSMEVRQEGAEHPSYFPAGGRLRYRIVREEALAADAPARELPEVEFGQRGRVVADRFDPSMMILNMIERDEAARIAAGPEVLRLGFSAEGLARPELASALALRTPEGIY